MSNEQQGIEHFALIPVAPKEVPELLRKLLPRDLVRYRMECNQLNEEGATFSETLTREVEAIIERQQVDRFTIDEAAFILARETGDSWANWRMRIVEATQAKTLHAYSTGSVAPRRERVTLIDSSLVEVYGDDLNQWLPSVAKRALYRFPPTGTPLSSGVQDRPVLGQQLPPPPLPQHATLSEAAKWMTFKTGQAWDTRAILGCAARGELTVFGSLQSEAHLVRLEPTTNQQNETTLQAGVIAPLDSTSAAKLLHGPSTTFTGLDHWVRLPGLPTIESSYVIGRVWAIAESTEAPKVLLNDCTVLAEGVEKLALRYTAPSEQQQGATDQDHPSALDEDSNTKAKSGETSWWSVASEYMIEKLKTGQHKTAKSLYHALEADAGAETSPFSKGTGANRGSLFVKDIRQTLALKTVQNHWPQLKEAARSVD